MKFAYLSQHLAELEGLAGLRVREVLARYNTRYEIEGRELSPSQLLERLGFSSAHLSAHVRDLSGGQKRRLQLMLVLLDRPNVLILDEPDNDLDTDMLTVVEGLLDTWPGTLLLITHDRHLMERVTDHQYAVINGKVRHLPGGVDEYLRLLEPGGQATSPTSKRAPAAESASAISQAERRRLKKELASIERQLESAGAKANDAREMLADTSPSDYVALLEAQARLGEAERRVAVLEDEWLQLSELLS